MLDFDSFDYFAHLLAAGLIVVPCYYLVRWAVARRLLLGLLGVYLVTLIAPRLTVFYLLFWAAVFGLQYLIRLPPERFRWVALTLAVGLLLAPMIVWKLAPTPFIVGFNLRFNELINAGSPWFGAIDRVRDIILPIGLSFATFRAIDLLVKVHVGLRDPLSPSVLFAFGFFPPVQVIGPVIEVTEVDGAMQRADRADHAMIAEGLLLVGLGLTKVFVMSYFLEPASAVLSPTAVGSWWEFWFELFRFAFYFYFNFSGFSDMAVGAALLFGLRLKPNFNNPYAKTNPQAFWNSWHMSLSSFCQRNVFVPLGGMRSRTQFPALVATMMTIALWHDISIPLVLFGLYHSGGLIAHRLAADRRPARTGYLLHVGKSAVLFVFFCLSLPLLLLQLNELPRFYLNLIGVT